MEKKSSLPPARKSSTHDEVVRPNLRWSSKEMNAACYRLAHVPEKKSIQTESNEGFAVSFYKNNTDKHPDTEEPEKKLQKINDVLGDIDDLSFKEKQPVLVKRKALTYMVFGENSIKSLMALFDLGKFYHENKKHQSAIRHLTKGMDIASNEEVKAELDNINDMETSLSIETAESYYDLANQMRTQKEANSKEIKKKISSGYNIVSKFDVGKMGNKELKYRCCVLRARMLNYLKLYKQAIEFYECAVNTEKDIYGENANELIGDLMVEWAENNEMFIASLSETELITSAIGEKRVIRKLYSSAIKLYQSAGFDQKAIAIRERIEKLFEGEEEEEENDDFQNGDEAPEANIKSENEYKPVTTDDGNKFILNPAPETEQNMESVINQTSYQQDSTIEDTPQVANNAPSPDFTNGNDFELGEDDNAINNKVMNGNDLDGDGTNFEFEVKDQDDNNDFVDNTF